mgnify:CR=1 FL=1
MLYELLAGEVKGRELACLIVMHDLNVAAQFRDYVTPAEVDSTDDIPPGCGALLRDGARKVAAYIETRGLYRLARPPRRDGPDGRRRGRGRVGSGSRSSRNWWPPCTR